MQCHRSFSDWCSVIGCSLTSYNMKNIVKTICLILFIGVAAKPMDNEEYETLSEPECLPVDLLVELPIARESFHTLSSTHAYVRRCIGVNDDSKACVHKDQNVMEEHWIVVKDKRSNKKEFIHVSWVSHEQCGYQARRNCAIFLARKCHEKSTTHYYDEVNCTCTCIVQIDGEDTCTARATSGTSLFSDNISQGMENPVNMFISNELNEIKRILLKLENAITPNHNGDNVTRLPSNTNMKYTVVAGQPHRVQQRNTNIYINLFFLEKDVDQGSSVEYIKGKWRSDRRCGDKVNPNGDHIQFLLPNGQPVECDPNSENFCCSAWGYCGGLERDINGYGHCSCDTCDNFRERNHSQMHPQILSRPVPFSLRNHSHRFSQTLSRPLLPTFLREKESMESMEQTKTNNRPAKRKRLRPLVRQRLKADDPQDGIVKNLTNRPTKGRRPLPLIRRRLIRRPTRWGRGGFADHNNHGI